jgi:hypothetical protein
MTDTYSTHILNRHDPLENPNCLAGTSDEYYRTLLAALDLGWKVEGPVYLYPRWDESSPWVYHFILKLDRASHPHLITTPKSPDIERLIIEEGWPVVRYPAS